MSATTTDQATIVRVPTNNVFFAKDHPSIATKTNTVSLDSGFEAKTNSLGNELPPVQVASAPQLTAPTTLPGRKDTQTLLNDLDKFDGLSLKFDEQRFLSRASDAINSKDNNGAFSATNKGGETAAGDVRSRLRAIIFQLMNNKQKSQEFRSTKTIEAAALYTKVVETKVDALYKQGTKGLTGSVGAAAGSALIAGGGLWLQGKATTRKTDVVDGREALYQNRQALQTQGREHLELEQQLRVGNLKKDAYEEEKRGVDRDIIDAKEKSRAAGSEAQALRAENQRLRSELGLSDQRGISSQSQWEAFNVNSNTHQFRPSSSVSITDPDFWDKKPVQNPLNSTNIKKTDKFSLPKISDEDIKPPMKFGPQQFEDQPPLPFGERSAYLQRHQNDFDEKMTRYHSNEKRISELERGQRDHFDKQTELENQRPTRLQQIEEDNSEIVSLIKQEKEAFELKNIRQDLVNKVELEMDRETIKAEREHTIGWTVVNLQTMSQMLQSGFQVSVKTEEGVAVKQDAGMNALQDEMQLYKETNTHDQNANDGLKNVLQETENSHNNTLKQMKT